MKQVLAFSWIACGYNDFLCWVWHTARYFASHIKTMLQTRKSVPKYRSQAIGPHQDLLAIIKGRKLRWYGHVSRLTPKPSARHCERGKKTRQKEEEVER